MYWLDIASASIETRPMGESGRPMLGPSVGADYRKLVDDQGMRPLIGVTTSELRPSRLATTRRHGEPAHPEMALGMTYLRTLDAVGAIPVVLPPVGTDHLAPLIERLDGICLSGGPDLDPAAYGAPERHDELGPTEPS